MLNICEITRGDGPKEDLRRISLDDLLVVVSKWNGRYMESHGCVWKCCVPHCTQWFCWSLSRFWEYTIKTIHNHKNHICNHIYTHKNHYIWLFSDKPIFSSGRLQILLLWCLEKMMKVNWDLSKGPQMCEGVTRWRDDETARDSAF